MRRLLDYIKYNLKYFELKFCIWMVNLFLPLSKGENRIEGEKLLKELDLSLGILLAGQLSKDIKKIIGLSQ